MDKDTILGPLTTEKRLLEVEALAEKTKQEGAKVLCGGKRPAGFNKGYFYEPTIFDDVKDNFTIIKEEPFGPLVPILTFKDRDEVVKRANDNDLGLASYIYTNSLENAHKVSEKMETGTCAVNTPAIAFAEVFNNAMLPSIESDDRVGSLSGKLRCYVFLHAISQDSVDFLDERR